MITFIKTQNRPLSYEYSRPFFEAQGMVFIPFEENEPLQRYVESISRQTVGEYKNLTQNTAFAVFDESGRNVAPLFDANIGKAPTSLHDTYTKVIDQAVTTAQLGYTDYQSAMRQTLKALAASGIRTVDYATGYSRRLDSAVRQNILWGIKQCNQNTADMVGEQFGADGYEIDYHSHPRPSHEAMGGRQYAIGKARTVNGVHYPSFDTVAHLLEDYGCLHFKFSILLGISEPAYDPEQLAAFKEADKQTFEFEGKKYTKYEASQVQRKLETAIRHQKDRANIAKAAGDDDMRRQAQEKINHLTSKYKKFSDASGLPTRAQRMSVSGFRRVKPYREYHLRNNLPKAYKDPRHVEEPISSEKLDEILSYAKSKGVQIGTGGISSGGFRHYCGDPEVLKDIIDEVARQQNSPLYKKSGAKPPILRYDNVLGYKGDPSKIDIDAFAMTKGRTITLNKFMFDDSVHLISEYTEAMKNGVFVKGTNYSNIISHEAGHIIGNANKSIKNKVRNCLIDQAQKEGQHFDDYLINNISSYCADLDEFGEYTEIISEINSLLTFDENNGIIKLLKEAGVI